MNFADVFCRATARVLFGRAALLTVAFMGGCSSTASLPPGSTSLELRRPTAGFSPLSHRVHRHSEPAVTITINPSQPGAAINVADLGSGMGVWYDFTHPGIAQAFQTSNLAITRFPGGAQADIYHWQTGTDGPVNTPCAGKAHAASTFDALMQDVAIPANLRVTVTLNYGSNSDCTAGADPSEGAGLIAYAQQRGYDVVYATIGNEQYAPGAVDCRQPGCRSSRDPYQYATNEIPFYNAVKQANPNVNVCIDADLQNGKAKWNPVVFSNAQYDCVEVHYYPQRAVTSDSFLLQDAVPQLTADLEVIEGEFDVAGRPNTPIYLGEIASTLGPYGKQSQSIVGALYAGMAIGEVEQDGLAAMTWHIGLGSCDAPSRGGDFGKDVYGYQDYGGAMIFSDGSKQGCPAQSAPNTLLATANAFLTASYFVHAGETMLAASVTGSTDVRAYAGTYKGGYAAMLFNLSESSTQNVTLDISGKNSGSGGTVVTYDKSIYDESAQNIWGPPSITALGSWNNSINLSLPPWSMVVAQTQ